MLFCFSELMKTLKPYSINPGESDENFVNDFLSPLIEVGKIKMNGNEVFYLSKPRVSDILNKKTDVPASLQSISERIDIEHDLARLFESQLESLFDYDVISKCIEAVCTLIGQSSNLSEEEKKRMLLAKDQQPLFFSSVLIKSLKVSNKDNRCFDIFSFGENRVNVVIGDLFSFASRRAKRNTIIVVPVNNSFDTVITRKYEVDTMPLVSDSTIHGQFIDRWIKGGHELSELDDMISHELSSKGYMPLDYSAGSGNGKTACYEIGSVVPITWNNSTVYLLPISEFDHDNVAISSSHYIDKALRSLMGFYNIYGQGNPLYIPLIGTGRSRANLSYQESFDLFIKVITDNQTKVFGNINLVITEDALSKINFKQGG